MVGFENTDLQNFQFGLFNFGHHSDTIKLLKNSLFFETPFSLDTNSSEHQSLKLYFWHDISALSSHSVKVSMFRLYQQMGVQN